jgi:hypothetical protein
MNKRTMLNKCYGPIVVAWLFNKVIWRGVHFMYQCTNLGRVNWLESSLLVTHKYKLGLFIPPTCERTKASQFTNKEITMRSSLM